MACNFRSLGQVATLGRRDGIADLNGVRLRGLLGWLTARGVHLMQAPGAASRLRVLSDWILSLLLRGNIVAFAGLLDPPSISATPAHPLAAPRNAGLKRADEINTTEPSLHGDMDR